MSSNLVSLEHCTEVSTKILGKLDEIEKCMRRSDDTLYGKVELGEPKGGLVNLVDDVRKDLKSIKEDLGIIKKNSKGKLTGKDKAIIYSSLIGSASAVVVALVK